MRSFRTASSVRSVSTPIRPSEKPVRFASRRSLGVSVSDRSRASINVIFSNARVNQGSTPVVRDSSSGLDPRLSPERSAQSRSSLGWRGSRESGPRPSPRHSGSSQSTERPVISSERTAFWNAASKVLSTAITSPVAFIWVPTLRSPAGNLSKGQRGIFTTQ